MRRQDIVLRRAAKEGDVAAALELARRYFFGTDGFPRHVSVGLEYVHPHRELTEAKLLVAESLTLAELLANNQEGALRSVAARSRRAQAKWAAWLCISGDLQAADAILQDTESRPKSPKSLPHLATPQRIADAVRRLEEIATVNGPEVAILAARRALACRNLQLASLALAVGALLDRSRFVKAGQRTVCELVWLSQELGEPIEGLSPQDLHDALEDAGEQDDARAWFTLGLALCGIACGPNSARALVTRQNMRRGAALLLRAADAGHAEAWLHLYALSSNGRSSVANPEMARFCLGKAAAAGFSEAQRRLGALVLRESTSLHTTEHAIALLHASASKGDIHATVLLRSLVLPVAGTDEEAAQAVDEIRNHDRQLAASLELAREFGLTRHEWSNLDLSSCAREWGLVTTPSRSLQPRLAAPRAIPALSSSTLSKLKAAALVARMQSGADFTHGVVDLRHLLHKLGVAEDLFFADAKVDARDRVRIGTRWAHHAGDKLRAALH